MKTVLLISLEVLCEDGFTVTIDKQDMSVQKNGQEIIRVTRNKQTRMWEVPLETQKSEDVRDTIMAQTLKTITITVPSCRTFQPNNSKPPQVNKKVSLRLGQE